MNDEPSESAEREERPQRFSLRRTFFLFNVAAFLPSVLAFGARQWWVLDLLTHFRLQYAAGSFVLLVASLWFRSWKVSLLPAVLLVWNGAYLVPFYLPARQPEAEGARVRVLLSNVLTSNRRHERLLEVVEAEDPDVVVLNEVDARWMAALDLEGEYPHSVAGPREDDFGVAVFSRLPIVDSRIVHLADSMVPSIVARLGTSSGRFTVVATHPVPPVGAVNAGVRNRHLAAVGELAGETPGPVVVAGDLNTTSWSPWFGELLKAGGLRDTRRGFGVQPSWERRNPALALPIDHVLVTEGVAVLDRRIGEHIGSDHWLVVVDLRLQR